MEQVILPEVKETLEEKIIEAKNKNTQVDSGHIFEELQKNPEEDEEEELEEQDSLIIEQIDRYLETFPKKLETFITIRKDISEMSNEELTAMLERIKLKIGTVNNANLAKILYLTGINILEKAAPIVGMQLDGLSMILQQNEDIDDILKELSIKYLGDRYVSPELRLGMVTATTIVAVNAKNKVAKKTESVLKTSVKKEIEDKYKDL